MNISINLKLKQIGIIKTPYVDNAPYQPVDKDKGNCFFGLVQICMYIFFSFFIKDGLQEPPSNAKKQVDKIFKCIIFKHLKYLDP